MEQWKLEWSDDFSCGDEKIDSAHKKIIEMANILEEEIFERKKSEEALLGFALDLADAVLSHMSFEIDLMRKRGHERWEEHEKDHILYQRKFDLKQNHDVSNRVRILMVMNMVKEYMGTHFLGFDIPDLALLEAKPSEEV